MQKSTKIKQTDSVHMSHLLLLDATRQLHFSHLWLSAVAEYEI
jgi:hypothetical protein